MGDEAAELARALTRRGYVEHPALPGRTNHMRAGVLVPLCWRSSGLTSIVTLRTSTLRQHSGEVCFPGGRREPSDASLWETARREATEEIGLAGVTCLGRLSSMPVYTSDFRLEPFVGQVATDARLVPEPGEVAEILTLDLDAVLSLGVVESVVIEHGTHVFEMPIFRPGGWVMFGATALTMMELLGVLADVRGRPALQLEAGDIRWSGLLRHGAAVGRFASEAGA